MTTDVLNAEWIGSRIKIVDALNKVQEGISGTLIDETKNLLVIETPKGVKRVQKSGVKFTVNGNKVEGRKVLVAPEERIKLKVE